MNEPITEDAALAADWAGFVAGEASARDRLYAHKSSSCASSPG